MSSEPDPGPKLFLNVVREQDLVKLVFEPEEVEGLQGVEVSELDILHHIDRPHELCVLVVAQDLFSLEQLEVSGILGDLLGDLLHDFGLLVAHLPA